MLFLSQETLTPQDLRCLAESHPEVLPAILLLLHTLKLNRWTPALLAQLPSLEWLAACTFLLHGLGSSVNQRVGRHLPTSFQYNIHRHWNTP